MNGVMIGIHDSPCMGSTQKKKKGDQDDSENKD